MLRTLAERLPRSVRLGTSSWSFPGWEGIVWGGRYAPTELARDGLAAYAQHPLLRSVGVDRTHYAPLPVGEFERWADAVPDDFRFLVKAHEACTLLRFPTHARYGGSRGQPNPDFLDPAHAIEEVVGPTAEGLGPKLGALLFQFAPQSMGELGGPRVFAERLHRFLDELPRSVPCYVEVRNPDLLTPAYAEALLATGVGHCVNVLERMPPPETQARLTAVAQTGGLVVRWMLARGMDYGTARSAFAPFDQLVAPDPTSRTSVAALVEAATRAGRQALVIVNNKAEGSSPRSLEQLARLMVDRLEAGE